MGEVTYSFPFRLPPYKHQFDSWTVSKDREAFALFLDMGCVDGASVLNVVLDDESVIGKTVEQLDLEWDRETPLFVESNDRNKQIVKNKVLGIVRREAREVIRITAGEYSVVLTPDHEVRTAYGWDDASNLRPGTIVIMGLDHDTKMRKITKVEEAGEDETFDVIMESPNNNFVANGFILHNCGKSKVLLDTAAHLHLKGEIKGLVLIAPKGVYLNWVDNEIPTHMSDAVKYSLAYWSSSPKAAEREALDKLMSEPGPHLRILCMNCEALTDIKCPAALYLKRFLGKCRGNALIAIDESTTIKNRKAHRTKILVKLGKLAKYRRILSGNPIPNGPMDLFSQVDFLDRSLLGFNDFYAFRNRFAVVQDMKFGQKSFQKVVGYRDTQALKSKMQEFSFIIKKKDCLDLPEKVYQVIDVEMGEEQAKAYNQMVDDAYVELANGATCTALMVMTQYTRLHQIACGFLSTDQGDLEFPGTNHRIEALLEELEVSREYGKVIIWCTYRTNIAQIKKAVEEKFGKESLVEFWGDIKQEERREAKTKFQDPSSKAEFFLSNPATGKFGNTLTKGVTSIYFSNDYNLEHRDQSEDRAHRIGLEKTAIYKDLRVRGTVDDRIIKILKGKKKLSDEIVASNWKWFIGEKV